MSLSQIKYSAELLAAVAIGIAPPFGPFEGCVPMWRLVVGVIGVLLGFVIALCDRRGRRWSLLLGGFIFIAGSLIWLTGHVDCR
jgi:hypothetical protein